MSYIPTATGRRGSTPSPTGTYANREETIERLWTFLSGLNTSGFTMATGAASGRLLTSDASGAASWQAPSSAGSFQDSTFSIFDNLDVTKIAQFQCSGITPGTTRTFTFPNADSTLAVLSAAQTFTAKQTINPINATTDGLLLKATGGGYIGRLFEWQNSAGTPLGYITGLGDESGEIGSLIVGRGQLTLPIVFWTKAVQGANRSWGVIYDGTNTVPLEVEEAMAGTPLVFPGAGGTVVSTDATQNLFAKTLKGNTNIIETGSNLLTGTRFQDSVTSSKTLRVQLNQAATTAHVLRLINTAQRTYTLPDGSGNILVDAVTHTRTGTNTVNGVETFTKRPLFNGEGATAAAMLIGSQTTPSSPAAGDLWHDGTQKRLMNYLGYMNETIPGVLFTKTGTTTVADTTTPTDLVTAGGVGSAKIAANSSAVGKTIRVTARGVYGTKASPTGTLELHIGINGVSGNVLCTTGAQTPTVSLTNRGWQLQADITVRTVAGASSTLFSQGMATLSTAAGTAVVWDMENTATTTHDLSTNLDIFVVATWSTANASNTISCTNLVVTAEN